MAATRETEASPLSLASEATASAFEDARASFERLCLAARIEAMELFWKRQQHRSAATAMAGILSARSIAGARR
jgi:hypothetical protein